MKKILLSALLIMIVCASFSFAEFLGDRKVYVKVNGELFPPTANYPIVRAFTKHAVSGKILYNKTKHGHNPTVFSQSNATVPQSFTVTLPNGDKKTVNSFMTWYNTYPEKVTVEFTCAPSNTIIVKHYVKGTTAPVPATISLVRMQSSGNVLQEKKHTNSQGRVEFDKVWRGYKYYAECRPDSDKFSNTKVDISAFPSDFMTKTVTAYCIKYGQAPVKKKDFIVPDTHSVPAQPSAPQTAPPILRH